MLQRSRAVQQPPHVPAEKLAPSAGMIIDPYGYLLRLCAIWIFAPLPSPELQRDLHFDDFFLAVIFLQLLVTVLHVRPQMLDRSPEIV